MARVRRLSVVARKAAVLAGKVARGTELPRSRVEEYLGRHLDEVCLAELGSAWLEGWDGADSEGVQREVVERRVEGGSETRPRD